MFCFSKFFLLIWFFKSTFGNQIAPRLGPNINKVFEFSSDDTVLCGVEKGSQPLNFEWRKDGVAIKDLIFPNNYKIVNKEASSFLNILQLRNENQGNYTCIVSNNAGLDSWSIYITIKATPKWVKEPNDVNALVGQSLKIDCDASGVPKPEIYWQRVDSNERDKRKVFSITSVSKSDAGKYKCVVTNKEGDVLEKVISVTISVPAKFEEKYATFEGKAGESVEVTCPASGDQPLTVTWIKGTKELEKRGSDNYEIFDHITESGINSEMVIKSLQKTDGSTFKCIAENSYGKDERIVKLVVKDVPSAPTGVRIKETWSGSASVNWTPSFDGNSPVLRYIIQYWMHKSASKKLFEITVSNSQRSALIKDLKPGQSYEMTVLAENDVGRSDTPDPIPFVTLSEEPSSPPIDVNVEARGPKTIRVTWKAPPREYWNGNLLGYYIGFKEQNSQLPYSFRSFEISSSSNLSHVYEFYLTNLLKTTSYDIVVKAYNNAGASPQSHRMRVKTLDGELPSPVHLSTIGNTKNSIQLKWSAKASTIPITSYTFHFQPVNEEWRQIPVSAAAIPAFQSGAGQLLVNSYNLINLASGVRYNIFMTATNMYGVGDKSNIISTVTEGGYNDLPYFFQPIFFIPILIAIVIISTVLVITVVCVKRMKPPMELQESFNTLNPKRYSYPGTTQRYVDFEKTSKSSIGDGMSSSGTYATLPMNSKCEDQFPQQWDKSSMANSIRKDSHIYDNPH